MSAPAPLPCVYHEADRSFRVLPRAHNLASAHYGDGEVVMLAPVEERSHATHAHEFAWLRDAWLNLPDHLADQFPTAKHLRKRGLIDAGFYDEQIIDAGTNAAALRVAQGIRSRPGEAFSLVIVRGPAVVIRTAKSQSRRAMDKHEFQASKTALLETVSAMIGVTPEALKAHGRDAA